jgi:hypothetical protein
MDCATVKRIHQSAVALSITGAAWVAALVVVGWIVSVALTIDAAA